MLEIQSVPVEITCWLLWGEHHLSIIWHFPPTSGTQRRKGGVGWGLAPNPGELGILLCGGNWPILSELLASNYFLWWPDVEPEISTRIIIYESNWDTASSEARQKANVLTEKVNSDWFVVAELCHPWDLKWRQRKREYKSLNCCWKRDRMEGYPSVVWK